MSAQSCTTDAPQIKAVELESMETAIILSVSVGTILVLIYRSEILVRKNDKIEKTFACLKSLHRYFDIRAV